MKKIRLICSDIDGTLVADGTSGLNPEIYDVILELKAHGIYFVAASGRQVISIEKLFAPVRDKIFYVAENGTYIGSYGRELFTHSLATEDVHQVIRYIHQYMPDCDILLSGPRRAYTDSKNPEFLRFVLDGYRYDMDMKEDLAVFDGSFIKIAIYHKQMPQTYIDRFREKWGGQFKVVTSGDMWIDLMDLHANKGLAVKELQESLFITPEETVAFGDQQNDIEMLERAYYSYAVANALPQTKRAARFIADSNQNNGVLKVLKKLLAQIKESEGSI